MSGVAAPNPLRRHGLPVAPLVAAYAGKSNAGGPCMAVVASSSASTSSPASHDPLVLARCRLGAGHERGCFPRAGRRVPGRPRRHALFMPAALNQWWSQMLHFVRCMRSHGVPN
jgi:hypothetical protein